MLRTMIEILSDKDVLDLLLSCLLLFIIFGFGSFVLKLVTFIKVDSEENNTTQLNELLTPAQKDVIIGKWILSNGYVSDKTYQSIMHGKYVSDIQIYNTIEEKDGYQNFKGGD